MESNKNDNNNGIDNKHEQPPRSERKCKLNELTKDEDKPAEAAGQEDQECANSKKNREEGNDLLDLELESLSRVELINLVQKQMQILNQNDETIKQLGTTKKEAEESANRQAEEFSERIVNLQQEKAEIHADLRQKMAEIEEMHKEVEEKSEELKENANQIDALLMQLKESTSHQRQMPAEQEMKMRVLFCQHILRQLSLETWYDWLGFVPRPRLGQIVPKIGDRRFGSIVQKFLHEYGEIKIGHIQIVAPYEEDASGCSRVRVWKDCRPPLRFEMAEAQMPANIKTFSLFELSYFDQSVLNFMQKFQQNGLLDNVTLEFGFGKLPPKDKIQPVLCHLLPLFNGIKSIEVENSAQLVEIYNAGNSKEIYELNMEMMKETIYLYVSDDNENFHAKTIDLYCRWLYQPAHADGKSRGLQFGNFDRDSAPVSLFVERIKQDFLMATDPVTFFIRINLQEDFHLQKDICLDNGKTKERLLTKMEETEAPDPDDADWKEDVILLISRYPLGSTKKWIEENEKEVSDLDFAQNGRRICLSEKLKVVPI